jgi:hypothetical protein
MADQALKRGRPPKHGEAMTGAERQALYAKVRARDMAEVAYALKDALAVKETQKAFVTAYSGTPSEARLLADDPETMVFFDGLILSDDGN